MTHSPILWGIGLAVALGGAITGNAVGSAPVTDRSAMDMLYQSHEAAFADGQGGGRALPNHYPLVTRDGVIEVAQLSDRGLFSQARYRSVDIATVPAYTGAEYGPEFAEQTAAPAPQFAEASVPAEPVDVMQDPSQEAGDAKIIDVRAALAMR